MLYISLTIQVCLLDFLLVSTSTADILQDKNRTNAMNSEDIFSKCYLMMLHLNLLKNYSPEQKAKGTTVNLLK